MGTCKWDLKTAELKDVNNSNDFEALNVSLGAKTSLP